MADAFETQDDNAQTGALDASQTSGSSNTEHYADQLAAITAEDGRQKYGDVQTALESQFLSSLVVGPV